MLTREAQSRFAPRPASQNAAFAKENFRIAARRAGFQGPGVMPNPAERFRKRHPESG
jgi:hypothetical protein